MVTASSGFLRVTANKTQKIQRDPSYFLDGMMTFSHCSLSGLLSSVLQNNLGSFFLSRVYKYVILKSELERVRQRASLLMNSDVCGDVIICWHLAIWSPFNRKAVFPCFQSTFLKQTFISTHYLNVSIWVFRKVAGRAIKCGRNCLPWQICTLEYSLFPTLDLLCYCKLTTLQLKWLMMYLSV